MDGNKNFCDRNLIKDYLKGDEKALEMLVKTYKSKIYTAIYLLVKNRDAAEDLFQDTFIKIIDALRSGKYNEEGKFLPWALRIARNLVIDYFRNMRKSPASYMLNSDDIDDGQEANVFNKICFSEEDQEQKFIKEEINERQAQFIKNVQMFIAKLPEEQREALVLRHYAEMSFKEIAKVTNVSINTALGRIRYGIANLRKMIAEKYNIKDAKLIMTFSE